MAQRGYEIGSLGLDMDRGWPNSSGGHGSDADGVLPERVVRIMIVDHHEMFVESLGRMLRDFDDLEVVGAARSRAIAVDMARSLSPSVATVDAWLPDGTGIDAAVEIKQASPSTQIVILTETIDIRLAAAAIKVGCLGFLTKDNGIRDLLAAVHLAHEGNPYLIPEVLPAVMPQQEKPLRGFGTDLTVREREILQMIAAGGLGNKAIASQLGLSLHTVRNHIQSVLAKLGAHSKLEAVVIAGNEGLLDRARQ
jgi:DNA-binding NarL/FixJ family response regulator